MSIILLKQNTNFKRKIKDLFKVYRPLLSTHFDHLSGNMLIPRQKNCLSFEANQSDNQLFTYSKQLKCCSANVCVRKYSRLKELKFMQYMCVPLTTTNGSRKEPSLVNMAGGVAAPNQVIML